MVVGINPTTIKREKRHDFKRMMISDIVDELDEFDEIDGQMTNLFTLLF
jgi:hypothetical protein